MHMHACNKSSRRCLLCADCALHNAVLCGAGASGDLAQCIAEVIRPAAVAAYQEAIASVKEKK